MAKIRAIVAVGTDNQIGLDGELPWRFHADDMAYFRNATTNGLVITGYHTWPTVKDLDDTRGRKFIIDPLYQAKQLNNSLGKTVNEVLDLGASKGYSAIWVAGGNKTYKLWAPFVDEWWVSFIDYDGPADTHFDVFDLTPYRRPGVIRAVIKHDFSTVAGK